MLLFVVTTTIISKLTDKLSIICHLILISINLSPSDYCCIEMITSTSIAIAVFNGINSICAMYTQ